MKKSLLFFTFILLIIPTIVFASDKVELKDITLKEKSTNTKILKDASIVNDTINFNLEFYDKDDYALYEVTIKNPNSEGLYINDIDSLTDNNILGYDLLFKDGSNYIKSGEEKVIILKVFYKTEISSNLFKANKYEISDSSVIPLTNKLLRVPNTIKNVGILLISLFIFVIICIFFGTYNLYFNKKNITIIVICFLLLPLLVSALNKIDIPVNSKVVIKKIKDNYCTYDGEMTSGAEYVNGQYKYVYKKKVSYSSYSDLYYDGWSVVLNDMNSTDPVTTKLCTFVNDKPVVSMSYMFYYSKTTSIDLSSFNTSNIVYMDSMFNNVDNIVSLDVSGFDTSNVKSMDNMFAYCDNLEEINVSSFDARKAGDNNSYTFGYNPKLKKVDMSGFLIRETNTRTVINNDCLDEIIAPKTIINRENYLPEQGNYFDKDYNYYVHLSMVPYGTKLTADRTHNVIKFIPRGGILEEKAKLVPKDQTTLGELPTPIRDGYTFLGWTRDSYTSTNYVNENSTFDGRDVSYASFRGLPSVNILYAVWSNPDTFLAEGNTVNSKFRSLVYNATGDYGSLKYIKRATSLPNMTLTGANEIQHSTSNKKIYAWFDIDTIYIYSEADKIYLNKISNSIFADFTGLETVELSMFDFSNVISFYSAFRKTKVERIDLSSFKFDSLTEIQYLCENCTNLKYLNMSSIDSTYVNMYHILEGVNTIEEFVAPKVAYFGASTSYLPQSNIAFVDEDGDGFHDIVSGMKQGSLYKKAYKIVFDRNTSGFYNYLDIFMTYDNEETIILPTPIKDGYNFLGWSTSNSQDNVILDNKLSSIRRNYKLYGIWEEIT